MKTELEDKLEALISFAAKQLQDSGDYNTNDLVIREVMVQTIKILREEFKRLKEAQDERTLGEKGP